MNNELKTAILQKFLQFKKSTPSESLAEFKNMPEEDLIFCHFGLGLYLRNYVLAPESELYKLFVENGVINADEMSSIMIKEWHKVLKIKI